MEIPHRGARPSTALPAIFIQDSNHYPDRSRISSRSNPYAPASISPSPMSIPTARDYHPPPPLPPPKNLKALTEGGVNEPDLAWQWGNLPRDKCWGPSSPSVASSLSIQSSSIGRNTTSEHSTELSPREGSKSTSGVRDNALAYVKDEGYASLNSASTASDKSTYQDFSNPRAFQSSIHERYRNNTQAYDKSLLQKLSCRGSNDATTSPRLLTSSTFTGSSDSPTSRIAHEHRLPKLKPLSMPARSSKSDCAGSLLTRWGDSNTASPVGSFPRSGGIAHFDCRSPNDALDAERSPIPYIRKSCSASARTFCDDTMSATRRPREIHSQRISPDHDELSPTEEGAMKRLQIDDYRGRYELYSPGSAAGQKRRASSPPREEGPSLHTVGSASDLFRRRESASRASPGPPYHSTNGSVSSTASGPRNSSHIPALSLSASSITVPSPYGLSPGVSPGTTDTSLDSPYMNSMSLNPSPRSSHSRTAHHRTLSETRPQISSRKMDGMGHTKNNSVPTMQGMFICECCPKKPKKFDSQEELNIHEQEKQYECAYCRNRFKNKNEAERHQNSLHLRRHSWSCAALSGYAAAFHPSPLHTSNSDTCGYCGEEFLRSGLSSPSLKGHSVAIATAEDWDARILHLQEMHKFGECNHAKKFFRADHFRQHLKHSHAGTSGKWTNMLENACMKDEPLPEPINRSERGSPGGHRVSMINEEEEVF